MLRQPYQQLIENNYYPIKTNSELDKKMVLISFYFVITFKTKKF